VLSQQQAQWDAWESLGHPYLSSQGGAFLGEYLLADLREKIPIKLNNYIIQKLLPKFRKVSFSLC
jgi:hypothetical protein